MHHCRLLNIDGAAQLTFRVAHAQSQPVSGVRARLKVVKEINRAADGLFPRSFEAKHSGGRDLTAALADAVLEDIDRTVLVVRRSDIHLIEIAVALRIVVVRSRTERGGLNEDGASPIDGSLVILSFGVAHIDCDAVASFAAKENPKDSFSSGRYGSGNLGSNDLHLTLPVLEPG
jgi:hypothetical protein